MSNKTFGIGIIGCGLIGQKRANSLGEGGRLVAPTGDEQKQKLMVLKKKGDRVIKKEICDCKFVPLVGKYGWPEK